MNRVEFPHNTPEQVAGYIADAARIVVEAELYPDLQGIAFTKAIDLLAAKTVHVEQVQPGILGAMHVPRG